MDRGGLAASVWRDRTAVVESYTETAQVVRRIVPSRTLIASERPLAIGEFISPEACPNVNWRSRSEARSEQAPGVFDLGARFARPQATLICRSSTERCISTERQSLRPYSVILRYSVRSPMPSRAAASCRLPLQSSRAR